MLDGDFGKRDKKGMSSSVAPRTFTVCSCKKRCEIQITHRLGAHKCMHMLQTVSRQGRIELNCVHGTCKEFRLRECEMDEQRTKAKRRVCVLVIVVIC